MIVNSFPVSLHVSIDFCIWGWLVSSRLSWGLKDTLFINWFISCTSALKTLKIHGYKTTEGAWNFLVVYSWRVLGSKAWRKRQWLQNSYQVVGRVLVTYQRILTVHHEELYLWGSGQGRASVENLHCLPQKRIHYFIVCAWDVAIQCSGPNKGWL